MDSHQVPCIPIQSHSSPSAPAALRCCCGRDDCAFLHHNQVALEGLEKDLDTAAKLGQALLHRHESYMAEAEEDRHRLLFSVESLEREKLQAQAENARIIAENRNLLEQLEDLNKAVTESDARATSLAVTLETTEAQLRKLTVSAARAADLEAQLAQMEAEQSKLQESLQSAHEDNKSAVQRWKKAECTLRDLHDQVDRIEKEAREERDRHSDLIQRMERRRTVERELDGAAGRLKGAAAAQELGRSHGDNNVVSRFVRDILQDNASLQMGIVELREMLESSNQEVQNLRDQVLYHQPMASDAGGEPDQATTLSQELESKEERRVSQEFHIHHHYHTPSVKKEKGTLLRRSKKRRSWGNPAHLHSAPGALLLPRRAGHRSQSSTSSTSTILSQTSVSIPPSASHRWSLQTPATDSLASSPQSGYRSSSSLFDRVERCFDSQPTSPESSVFMTSYKNGRSKNGREGQDDIDDLDPTPCYGIHPYDHPDHPDKLPMQSVIPEEAEDSSIQYPASERAELPGPAPDVFTPYRPLRRGSSHESLFSVAGMDIHTPSHQPSRMSDLTGTLPIRIPRRIVSSTAELSATPPVISTNTVTADRGPLRAGQSPQTLLASVAGAKHHDASSVDSDHSNATVTPTRKMPLTRRVGGWVRGRWGTAPVTSDEVDHPPEPTIPSSPSSSSSRTSSVPPPIPPPAEQPRPSSSSGDKNRGAPSLLHFRFPGVNQKGPIMGFRPPPRAPAVLHPENLDEGLLRESLAE